LSTFSPLEKGTEGFFTTSEASSVLLQIFIAPSMSRLKDSKPERKCSGIAPFHSSREVGTPNHSPSEKKDKKKDKNQLFETAVKQPPGGYMNSTKYEKAPQDFE